MEYWELYDKEYKPLGKVVPRGSELQKGEYFRISGVICINEKGEILTTKRSPQKDSHPNHWEFTCGTLEVGEDLMDGAIRELEEETGIVATKDELTFLGSYREEDKFSFVYLLHFHGREEDLRLQEEEVSDFAFLNRSEFLQKCQEGYFAPPMQKRLAYFYEQYEGYLK